MNCGDRRSGGRAQSHPRIWTAGGAGSESLMAALALALALAKRPVHIRRVDKGVSSLHGPTRYCWQKQKQRRQQYGRYGTKRGNPIAHALEKPKSQETGYKGAKGRPESAVMAPAGHGGWSHRDRCLVTPGRILILILLLILACHPQLSFVTRH